VPDLVAMKDRKGLSAMDVVSILTRVVQEQQKKINEQKEINEYLIREIEKLKEGK
jgi:cell division protein FtsB